MKVYFAHPVSFYGTPIERDIVRALEMRGFAVINPSDSVHQNKVSDMRAKMADGEQASRQIMEYFVNVCRACDSCVFMVFPDGSLGAGVVAEAQFFLDQGREVFEARVEKGQVRLHPVKDLAGYKCLSVAETREMLKSLRPSKGLQRKGF